MAQKSDNIWRRTTICAVKTRHMLSPATMYVDVHGTYCRRMAYIVAGDNICRVLLHILLPVVTYCHSSMPFQFYVIQYLLHHTYLHVIVMPTFFQALDKTKQVSGLALHLSFSSFFTI